LEAQPVKGTVDKTYTALRRMQGSNKMSLPDQSKEDEFTLSKSDVSLQFTLEVLKFVFLRQCLSYSQRKGLSIISWCVNAKKLASFMRRPISSAGPSGVFLIDPLASWYLSFSLELRFVWCSSFDHGITFATLPR